MKQQSHFVESVASELTPLGLCRDNIKLLLAVSGGADSMALLHVMLELAAIHALDLHVAHVNHLIRDDAGQDAELIRDTCLDYGLPFTYAERDVPAAAKQSGQSLEMEARKQRYKALAAVYHEMGADALLTAHNSNDQTETILLNLSRGCSPAALAGIATDTHRAGMRMVRPMLKCSREDIVAYLTARNLVWREDTTNADTTYRRNAIRHNILPAMRQHLNPELDAAFQRCADLAQADESYLQSLALRYAQDTIPSEQPDQLNLASYRSLPGPLRNRLLVQWLWREKQVASRSLTLDLVQQLDWLAMHASTGKQLPLPGGKTVQQSYDRLVMRSIATGHAVPAHSQYPLDIPGTTNIPEWGWQIEVKRANGYTKQPVSSPGTLPATCHIRRPQANESLWIRTRQPGDRIHMTGAQGHQKLQDIFTNGKVPAYERNRIPLLATDQELVWIPGLRIASDWTVSSKDAQSLCIRISSPLTSGL